MKKNVAVFASGTGSNFERIHQSLQSEGSPGRTAILISNNAEAPCIKKAAGMGIPVKVIKRSDHESYESYSIAMIRELKEVGTDIIALAGYLVKLPTLVVNEYADRIINIHPALLPSFGGKGFYGQRVHEAVLDAGVKVTGITVHFVNSEYDRGSIILQKCVDVDPEDTAESLGQKVLALEHRWFPYVVKLMCEDRVEHKGGKVFIHE